MYHPPPPAPVFRVWLFDTSADRYNVDVLHHIVSLFSATFLIDLAPHININQVALTIVFQKPLQQSTSSKLDFCLSELSYLGVNRYIRFPQLHSSDCEYFIGFIVIDVKVHYIVLIRKLLLYTHLSCHIRTFYVDNVVEEFVVTGRASQTWIYVWSLFVSGTLFYNYV